MSLYKDGDYWYYCLKDPRTGKWIRKSTRKTSKSEARVVHDDAIQKLKDYTPSSYSLKDCLDDWQAVSDRTKNEKSAIHVLLKHYPSRPITDVHQMDITIALSGRAQSTINRTMRIVRAAINLYASANKCPPCKFKIPKDSSKSLRYLRKHEWEALLNNLPDHARAMAEFSTYSGLRRSNVMRLRWQSVDLDREVAWVDAKDAKGGSVIPVPLSKKSVEVLRAQEGKHPEYVFTFRGKPVRDVKKSFKKALVAAGIDVVERNGVKTSTFRWHDLRHTWASWHTQNGTPVRVLQELGGWQSTEMLERYSHLSPDHLRKWTENV